MREGSKYHALYQHLQTSGQAEVVLTFGEIEAFIGRLPASARQDRTWWGNRRVRSVQSTAWMEAGYHVVDLDLAAERVTFRKPTRVYNVRRVGDLVLWDSELIRALRAHMEMSQTQMAAELGVRQQTISEWETGMYQPTRAMSKLLSFVAERAGFTYGEEAQS
jgi:DNA-binding XRE family transcriptional regulator